LLIRGNRPHHAADQQRWLGVRHLSAPRLWCRSPVLAVLGHPPVHHRGRRRWHHRRHGVRPQPELGSASV